MKTILICFILFSIPIDYCVAGVGSSNSKGIRAYNEGNYEESVQHFFDALVNKPDSPELLFNLGTALAATGRKKEALEEFSKIPELDKNKDISASTHYNSGNLLLKSGDMEGAIREYAKALKFDQKSLDIRYNLEIALKQKEQQNQQQQSSNTSEQNQSDKKEMERHENPRTHIPHQTDFLPMSEEEAQRILGAFQNEERRALELKKKRQSSMQRIGNDW